MNSKNRGVRVAAHDFLSIDEAAVLLRVNRNTLYEAAKRNELPGVVKIGRILRVRRSALMDTVDE